MCIGVPGQVLAVGEDIHQLAQVEVCGIKRDVNIALICEGNPADSAGPVGAGTRRICHEHHRRR
ncbi:hydrogenase-2 component protein [Escherichia coli]|uniref:Hydrogenase-2 component protein n=1 Tax=Escherichia coli TaxID=562 RepID=A0A376KNC2_ECOLX|nr:hydrogenase-2 component protein [Escherichia coli]